MIWRTDFLVLRIVLHNRRRGHIQHLVDQDAQIGRVKDMGSAAVGVMIVIAGLVWTVSLAERAGLL